MGDRLDGWHAQGRVRAGFREPVRRRRLGACPARGRRNGWADRNLRRGNECLSGYFDGPFGYGGPFGYQEDSETGYKLLGHRYYDPTTGRFLTRDKAKDGRNWYAYCDNNPLTRADGCGRRWTFVYRLLDASGELLKNGITRCLPWRSGEHLRKYPGSRIEEVARYEDDIPDCTKNGPYNRQALDHERRMNLEQPGPENHERYIKSRGSWMMFILAVLTADPIGAGESLGPAIDPYVRDANRGLTHIRINRWLGDDDEYTSRL